LLQNASGTGWRVGEEKKNKIYNNSFVIGEAKIGNERLGLYQAGLRRLNR
jgi:hypothetical protein